VLMPIFSSTSWISVSSASACGFSSVAVKSPVKIYLVLNLKKNCENNI
jgi:hypothetical protein